MTREIKNALVMLPYDEAHLHTIAKALSPAETVFLSVGDKTELERRLPEADVALLNNPPPLEVLARAGDLHWLHCDMVGMESVYAPEVAQRETLVVTNARGRSSAALAEHVLLFIMALSHRLPQLHDAQKARHWLPSLPPGAATLRGKTVGILGTGSIGVEVARLCAAFSMTTIGYQRGGKETPLFFTAAVSGRAGLENLLQTSDFVVLALPLTNETKGILGAKEFALMKPSAFLVNIARGDLLDEAALAAAIRSRTIMGAGLDTFSVEPLSKASPLWSLENVLITPHKTPPQPEKTEYSVRLILDNIAAYRNRTPLRNTLSPLHAYSSVES